MSPTSEKRHDDVAPPAVADISAAGKANETIVPDAKSDTANPPLPGNRKEPPPEKPEDVRRRSFIVASFWLIVLFLGLPIWWKTTTIYRADLPLSEMMDWADGKACTPVFAIRIALDTSGLGEEESYNLMSITQQALDAMGDFAAQRLQLEPLPSTGADYMNAPSHDSDAALVVRLRPGQTMTASLHSRSPVLDVTYPPNSIPSPTANSSDFATYLATQLRETFSEERDVMSYLLATYTTHAEPRPQGSLRDAAEASLSKRMTRSLKYSRTYHLTFSLFTNGPTPSSWDVDSAIDEYMRPILDMLGPIHNFTIDTQVQLYASPGVQSQVLTKEDLSSFINAAEWPLSPSIGGSPTVNFVMYVGNQTVGPDPGALESGSSHSWLIPQWGSVYLLPPPATDHIRSELLKQPILTFTSHLLSLLNTPQTGPLPMRLSTLTRIRSADLLLRASSSLGSLARLSLALPSISIPPSVADGVTKSMRHLRSACSHLGGTDGLEHARIAEAEAERAFFEKSMVGQLYFPDEHKVAIYLPLLGPVGVPLVIGLLSQVKAWKKRSREEKAKKKA
ncbi:phosphatidylinositol-glycan biosynthesis class S protein [Durotheca rogersii]|uniref:phosphatidylinositol-glycan biosynthesis class S protein n=1 Tax=Durotheca rogersii TaxID=419775 RepID=UPI00221FFAD6|nr:phosphatidylinositol-glycan biosynthesis class S protein [Durotheca rogersii]KAI5857390.1 phosphatidylinositol-glycan biosynthesis class S protein [Durotheca rogersii]